MCLSLLAHISSLFLPCSHPIHRLLVYFPTSTQLLSTHQAQDDCCRHLASSSSFGLSPLHTYWHNSTNTLCLVLLMAMTSCPSAFGDSWLLVEEEKQTNNNKTKQKSTHVHSIFCMPSPGDIPLPPVVWLLRVLCCSAQCRTCRTLSPLFFISFDSVFKTQVSLSFPGGLPYSHTSSPERISCYTVLLLRRPNV